jgi:glycosyltransferase involved in cell wall biosynthesis
MRLTELVTPLKPLEAMAYERAVAASDIGGHRELIRDGSRGRLFPAGSPEALAAAVVGLLERPRSDLVAEGRRYVESERTWGRSVEVYRDAYRTAGCRKASGTARAA